MSQKQCLVPSLSLHLFTYSGSSDWFGPQVNNGSDPSVVPVDVTQVSVSQSTFFSSNLFGAASLLSGGSPFVTHFSVRPEYE